MGALEESRLSVIIPVKNGEETLHLCLESIRKQTIGKNAEIIILDSMSTDNSRQIAEGFGAIIVDIPLGSFDHGLTRNKGVEYASGEYLYFTVQDARIAEAHMLEKMRSHFNDELVMAVVGNQVTPHEKDKNPFQWYRPISKPQVIERLIADDRQFLDLPAKEQQATISWDNVSAMYRRSALVMQPFVKTAFAEDWIWSYQAILKKWKLIFDSSLVVYHYHHQTWRYAFVSRYTLDYHLFKHFNYTPQLPALVLPILRATYHLGKSGDLSLKEKIYWIRHNWSANIARFSSTLNFLLRLSVGGKKYVEKGYEKYCKAIPQGMQNVDLINN
jgi:rhamnosyltransferase